MKLSLTLTAKYAQPVIPVNYQYPLNAAIYKILALGNENYSSFLHDTGYQLPGSLKSFKLFTFSDLRTPFRIEGDRLHLTAREATLIMSFHLPETAEHFIKGLFINQEITIADRISRAVFKIERVEILPYGLTSADKQDVILCPLSPVVCGRKNNNGNYDFLSPLDEGYEEMLFLNWKEKCRAVFVKENVDHLMEDAFIQILLFKNPPKSRLITIKAGTPAETKIRGFNNFNIDIKGKKEAIELLLNSGVGLYNAQGMGCVEIVH